MREPEIIPPIEPATRRLGAREAFIVIGVAAVLLVLAQGPSIKRTGQRMDPGPIRTTVLAVGRPAAWLAGKLPLAELVHDVTSGLSPDSGLAGGPGGFNAVTTTGNQVAPVTPDAFAPDALGPAKPPSHGLRKLLVTGDSMSQPLDAILARRLAGGQATQVIRDPHIGTGISKTDLLDWGKLSVRQMGQDDPDAVVVFLGANEGFPINGITCCGVDRAAAYATRVRTMMNTYRRANGTGRVYWLKLPLPRDPDRQKVARAVNAAVDAAAGAYRAQVRVLDMTTLFTPNGRFRESMPVDGRTQLVRMPDGIHLNETGSELAAGVVQRALAADFESVPAP